MKHLQALLISLIVIFPCLANTFCIPYQDSSLRERFVASLLNNYEQGGQWLFIEVDSCNIRMDSEVVNALTLAKCLEERSTRFFKEDFVFLYTETFMASPYPPSFNNCFSVDSSYLGRPPKYLVKGVKVNIERYNSLLKLPISTLLHKYFDKEKKILPAYKNILYDLIAVCFTRNVKLITYPDGNAVYEVFR